MVHARLELGVARVRHRTLVDEPDGFLDGRAVDLYVGRLHIGRHRRVRLVRHDHRRPEADHEPLGAQNDTHGAVHAVELDFRRLPRFGRDTRTATGKLVSWQHWGR